jgi:hypothetical protein
MPMTAASDSATRSGDGRVDAETASGEETIESIDPPESVGKDVIFGTLKNCRRRRVLRYLRDEGGQATLRSVSEHVASVENDVVVAAVTSKMRKRVYVSLYQVHLPGMDRDGIISFNKGRGTIELTDRADELFTYLETTENQRSGQRQYLAVSITGGLAYVFSSLLLGPGSLFATLTVIALISAVLTLSVSDLHDSGAVGKGSLASSGGLLSRPPGWSSKIDD